MQTAFDIYQEENNALTAGMTAEDSSRTEVKPDPVQGEATGMHALTEMNEENRDKSQTVIKDGLLMLSMSGICNMFNRSHLLPFDETMYRM